MAHPEDRPPHLQFHFSHPAQQFEAARMGMWLFLVTEVLFFGALFAGYLQYRYWYPEAFLEGSRHVREGLRPLDGAGGILGAVNTVVLLVSSLTVALAVHAAQTGRQKAIAGFLIVTILLGCVFLGIKVVEYGHKFEHHLVPGAQFALHEPYDATVDPRRVQLFFSFYFAMTGLHALHMVIGIPILATIAVLAWRGRFTAAWYTPVEVSGLYWHFVDIVWVFLFPLLYLIG